MPRAHVPPATLQCCRHASHKAWVSHTGAVLGWATWRRRAVRAGQKLHTVILRHVTCAIIGTCMQFVMVARRGCRHPTAGPVCLKLCSLFSDTYVVKRRAVRGRWCAQRAAVTRACRDPWGTTRSQQKHTAGRLFFFCAADGDGVCPDFVLPTSVEPVNLWGSLSRVML